MFTIQDANLCVTESAGLEFKCIAQYLNTDNVTLLLNNVYRTKLHRECKKILKNEINDAY